ncbi:MAG: phosphoglucosamine mutase, partial [bacterium]
MSRLMISISGIRGVIGEGLTPNVAMEFAQAFGTLCNGGAVVVGRDSRVSGQMMHNAIIAGLIAVGNKVVDIGISPTPTTQLATENLHTSGGIIITASHNPVMWNGMKLLAADGLFLDAQQGKKVLEIKEQGAYDFKSWDALGRVEKYDRAIDEHIEAVLALPYVNVSQIRARNFKVVADCINGAGAMVVPKLLAALGCESMIINGTPDGKFARVPEPIPENLGEVNEAVRQYGADLAVVVDPDADRLALVSEKGEPLGEEYTLALAVDFILERKKGPVVTNVSTTLALDDLAQKHGCRIERTKVGEINVAKHMREVDAVIGGEGNGGVILPDVHLGRDSLAGITLTLQAMAETGKTLCELHAELPQYQIIKEKIELAPEMNPRKIIDDLEKKYSSEKLDLTDGLKILRNNSWVQVRPSNTEPIIRVMAEAPTKDEAKALAHEMTKAALAK